MVESENEKTVLFRRFSFSQGDACPGNENENEKPVEPAKTVESARDEPAATKTAEIERVGDSASSHGNVTNGKSSAFPTAAAERAKAVRKSKEEKILAESGEEAVRKS
eukprot:9657082-Karenia_brevis.AAC.1